MLDITPIIIAGSVLVAAAIAYPFIKDTKSSDLLNFQSGGKKTKHRRSRRVRRTRRR
jgi:hypothetical protein